MNIPEIYLRGVPKGRLIYSDAKIDTQYKETVGETAKLTLSVAKIINIIKKIIILLFLNDIPIVIINVF